MAEGKAPAVEKDEELEGGKGDERRVAGSSGKEGGTASLEYCRTNIPTYSWSHCCAAPRLLQTGLPRKQRSHFTSFSAEVSKRAQSLSETSMPLQKVKRLRKRRMKKMREEREKMR